MEAADLSTVQMSKGRASASPRAESRDPVTRHQGYLYRYGVRVARQEGGSFAAVGTSHVRSSEKGRRLGGRLGLADGSDQQREDGKAKGEAQIRKQLREGSKCEKWVLGQLDAESGLYLAWGGK